MAGHVLRLQRERPAHTAMYWVPEDGTRKRGEAKEDMAKHLQRRPRKDGCQLAWSPLDRPMLREEQADLSLSKSSCDLHNKGPHVWAMEPLRFINVPYAE